MFVFANLLSSLAQLLQMAFQIYTFILIARVLVSWVNPDPFNPIMQFLVRATDPILEPLRRVIPPLGPIDISPIVALLLLQALQHFLVRTLWDLSARLH